MGAGEKSLEGWVELTHGRHHGTIQCFPASIEQWRLVDLRHSQPESMQIATANWRQDVSYRVMVYGSLKRGFYNNSVLPAGSRYLGEVKSEPGYTMISFGPYPGVIPVGDGVIHGELWQVPDLRALDRLEGNGRVFTRYERVFEDVNGVEYTAWVYLLPRHHRITRVIADGNWKPGQQQFQTDRRFV